MANRKDKINADNVLSNSRTRGCKLNRKQKMGCIMFSVFMVGAVTWLMGGLLRSVILEMDDPPTWLENADAFYKRWIFVPNLSCWLVGLVAMILLRLGIIESPTGRD